MIVKTTQIQPVVANLQSSTSPAQLCFEQIEKWGIAKQTRAFT